MRGQEQFGRPHNPDFLLRPDELREVYEKILNVVACEQGVMEEPRPAMLQRLCAVRAAS
jgi:hypothetical protein